MEKFEAARKEDKSIQMCALRYVARFLVGFVLNVSVLHYLLTFIPSPPSSHTTLPGDASPQSTPFPVRVQRFCRRVATPHDLTTSFPSH